jgi:hypothetical protein
MDLLSRGSSPQANVRGLRAVAPRGGGGQPAALQGPSRNSLGAFAFGGPTVSATAPPRRKRRSGRDVRPTRRGQASAVAWGGTGPCCGICLPPRPRQPTLRKKSVRAMSVDSCSGTKVWVVCPRIVDRLRQSPRNESGHPKRSWRAFGGNLSASFLDRLPAGRVRSVSAEGDLPTCSLA